MKSFPKSFKKRVKKQPAADNFQLPELSELNINSILISPSNCRLRTKLNVVGHSLVLKWIIYIFMVWRFPFLPYARRAAPHAFSPYWAASINFHRLFDNFSASSIMCEKKDETQNKKRSSFWSGKFLLFRRYDAFCPNNTSFFCCSSCWCTKNKRHLVNGETCDFESFFLPTSPEALKR